MLINELFIDHEKENKPLQMKILEDIISYEANWIFANTAIDILVKREPDYHNRDANTKARIDSFLANKEAAFEGKWHLEQLFESEYGTLHEESKMIIKEVANEYATIALEKFGWNKKEEKKS